MTIRLNTKILIGFTIALSVLMLTSFAAYFLLGRLGNSTRLVEHSYRVLQRADDVRLGLRDAQGAVRNYLMLNDTSYQRTYAVTAGQLVGNLRQLNELVADEPHQRAIADTLSELVNERLHELNRFRTYEPSTAVARALLLHERASQRRLKGAMTRLRAHEDGLLRNRARQQTLLQRLAPTAIVVSAVLAAIIVLGLFRRIAAELHANDRLRLELTRTNLDTARRIREMEFLTQQVVRGDYTVKLTDPGQHHDRLASLGALLNQMTQALETTFAALENRNRELDQFAYVASHDLKAPLRGLGTLVRWMTEELPDPAQAPRLRTYLDQMQGRLGRLENLINGLLAYARASRTAPRIELTDTALLVREVAELVVPPEVILTIAPGLPAFHTNRLALSQVLTNLLSNAVQYGQPATGPAQVAVSAHDLGEVVEFWVRDNGPGIAPAHHHKVFLLFQTLRDRHAAESTGIGLSIVKKVIDDQQGSIRVESALGQGAAFIFTWPKLAPTVPLPGEPLAAEVA